MCETRFLNKQERTEKEGDSSEPRRPRRAPDVAVADLVMM